MTTSVMVTESGTAVVQLQQDLTSLAASGGSVTGNLTIMVLPDLGCNGTLEQSTPATGQVSGLVTTGGGLTLIFTNVGGFGACNFQATGTISRITANLPAGCFNSNNINPSASFTLSASGSSLGASPNSLSFTVAAGGDSAPPQEITVTGTGAFTVSIDNGGNGAPPSGLSVKPASGTAPALVTVSASPGSSAPQTFPARIRIAPVFGAASVDIPVTFTVTPGTPKLDAAPAFLEFDEAASMPATLAQQIAVRNAGGGGPIVFQASVSGGSPWLSLSAASGSTSPNAATVIQVRANTTGLAVGAYTDIVQIASAAGSFSVAVNLYVTANGPVLKLSDTALHFLIRQGANITNPQTVNIFNTGNPSTTVNWKATVKGTPNFLSLDATSGTATGAQPGAINVLPSALASTLAPGAYYDLVTVTDPNAQNSPESFSVVLEVQAATATPTPELSPCGLLFVVPSGGNAPPAQPISVYVSSTTPLPFQATASTQDGGKWLLVTPSSGTTSTAATGAVSASIAPAGLPPGVYTGEVDLTIGASLHAVNITLLVLSPSSGPARSAGGCTPSRTVITETGSPGGFSVPAGWPASLAVLLTDDCGTPLPASGGSVVARFDNGDAPLTLHDFQNNGNYSADWEPQNPASHVAITFSASAGQLQPTTAQLGGGVNQNVLAPPVLFDNGTVNNVNPTAGTRVAAGTVASIYGQNLAALTVSPGILPLPLEFNGTSVDIGGRAAPLYFLSNGQLNLQIPAELAPNQTYQVAVTANNAFAVLQGGIQVTAAAPGVVGSFADGSIIAQHSDFTLVDAAHPAKPNEALVIYLSGMGATNPPVATGQQSPVSPLAMVTVQPTVTVDGQPANVAFAGLTPGGIGLYQINFAVPSNARAGDLAVVVKQGGAAANTTKLIVQP